MKKGNIKPRGNDIAFFGGRPMVAPTGLRVLLVGARMARPFTMQIARLCEHILDNFGGRPMVAPTALRVWLVGARMARPFTMPNRPFVRAYFQ